VSLKQYQWGQRKQRLQQVKIPPAESLDYPYFYRLNPRQIEEQTPVFVAVK